MTQPLESRAIRKLFVANRGEIAVRIIRACQSLGIQSVLGYSDVDRNTLGVSLADQAICIGPAQASDSYLHKETIIAAAKGTGCDAIHPGYGFLSEQATFRHLCDEHNIIFVGPSAKAIAALGDKLSSREIAIEAGISVVPGWDNVSSAEDVRQFGTRAGYPFLLKASAGGGGRGMRVVHEAGEAESAFERATAEAQASFGDPTLYIERYITRARHVEVQIMGDAYGKVLHFGERDCSTQRRHQKLIEEAPSTVIDDTTREEMYDAAVRLARHIDYQGAGTVEFIVDMDTQDFYFLEVNTRIQVEHPVTEMLTGHDLVAEMIKVAAGQPLALSQDDIQTRGHALECRINAEDHQQNFRPNPGKIQLWQPPAESASLRLDTHCYQGYVVPPFYDSMIGKLIVHASDRNSAISAMINALESFHVEGIKTSIPFHLAVTRHPDFKAGEITTRWVESVLMPQLLTEESVT